MANSNDGQADSLYSYDSFSGSNKTSNSNFLWWCAGAHQPLLKDYPSEHTKYAGLGGVVLATFILAMLSSGYAVYSVFGNIGWTIIVAVTWGLIIFNFDRFLVSTMRKYGLSINRQVWMAVPRIALALLIGVTIARPLELKIFEKEIDTRVVQNLHYKMLGNDSLLQVESHRQLTAAENDRSQQVTRQRMLEDTLHQLQQAYLQEADGSGGSGRRGIEQLTRLKMNAYTEALRAASPQLVQLQIGISRQDSIIAAARTAVEKQSQDYAGNLKNNIGFLERNKALSDLSNEEPSVRWTALLLSALIILIEIGPILSKLIMQTGPYDIALAKEELLLMAAAENAIRQDKEISYARKKAFYDTQKDLSGKLAGKMTALQQKHIDHELDKWEKGEWRPEDHRASMDAVMRKIKERYQVKEDDMF